jgi:hypothetical protein
LLRGEPGDIDGELSGLGQRLKHCRTQVIERLGPAGWEASRLRAGAMTVPEAIDYAVASLDALAGAHGSIVFAGRDPRAGYKEPPLS